MPNERNLRAHGKSVDRIYCARYFSRLLRALFNFYFLNCVPYNWKVDGRSVLSGRATQMAWQWEREGGGSRWVKTTFNGDIKRNWIEMHSIRLYSIVSFRKFFGWNVLRGRLVCGKICESIPHWYSQLISGRRPQFTIAVDDSRLEPTAPAFARNIGPIISHEFLIETEAFQILCSFAYQIDKITVSNGKKWILPSKHLHFHEI